MPQRDGYSFVFKYSKNSKDEWQWELFTRNGAKVAISANTYGHRWAARRSATSMTNIKELGYVESGMASNLKEKYQ